jgi:hypothetical protein
MSISISKTSDAMRFDSLLVLTRTAFGLGLGLLMAYKIKRPVRRAAAVTLLALGTLAATPFFLKLALEQLNRPESERGARARLQSIRGDSGYRSEEHIY